MRSSTRNFTKRKIGKKRKRKRKRRERNTVYKEKIEKVKIYEQSMI